MVLCPPHFKDASGHTALGSEGQTKLWRVMSCSLWKERLFRLSVGVNNGLIQLQEALRETGNTLQDANDKAVRRQAAARRQTSEFIRR